MNILHVTEDFSTNSGGLRTVIKDLDSHLNSLKNINSFVLSSQQEESDSIEVVRDAKDKPWVYSKEWGQKLKDIISLNRIDILHIHGVWMYPQYLAAKHALKNNIPFIISPHGMYEPWLWKQGRFKKNIYFKGLTKSFFSKANRIHAITEDEENNLKNLFPKSKFIQIPNLIDFSEDNSSYNEKEEKFILFLGRLHKKKGIELLIKSYSDLNKESLVLKIAGGFNDYKQYLDQIVKNLGLEKRVQFLGLVRGEEKRKLFRNAFVFVAPSFSEVVGMVNLEAAEQNTPVITTFQTGLDKKWNENGGILINPNQTELTNALKQVFSWSTEERNENGIKLRNFVNIHYSWEHRLNDWVNSYKTILKENNELPA